MAEALSADEILAHRETVAATALQIYGACGPTDAAFVAQRVVAAVDRAGLRGPVDGGPTPAEVQRAHECLHRHGTDVNHDDVYACLFAALCEHGWGE